MIQWNFTGLPDADYDWECPENSVYSFRCLVWVKFRNFNSEPEPRLAYYVWNTSKRNSPSYWQVEGMMGTVEVLAWAQINNPIL